MPKTTRPVFGEKEFSGSEVPWEAFDGNNLEDIMIYNAESKVNTPGKPYSMR